MDRRNSGRLQHLGDNGIGQPQTGTAFGTLGKMGYRNIHRPDFISIY